MPLEIQMVTLALANAWVREEGNIRRMPSRYYEWDSIERLSERMPPLSNTVAVPHGDALSHWQYGPRMLLQVRAHARAFAKFANVLPISMQNKCYSRSICMPVWFSRGHGRDIKGHGMLFYMR
jgi:hypothetical protein